MSRVLIAFMSLCLGWISWAHAEFEVRGLDQVLNSPWMGYSPYSFEQSMVCGQKQRFVFNTKPCTYHCTRYCMSRCEKAPSGPGSRFEFEIGECSSDRVGVFGDSLNLDVTKEEFDQNSRTWIGVLLRNLGAYIQPEGVLTLERVISSQVRKIGPDGEIMNVSVAEISGDIEFVPGTMKLGIQIGLELRNKGLAQLIYLREGSHVYIQQMGYILPN